MKTPLTHLYRHDGPGGPVRATSAAHAARVLARRLYGSGGRVESLLFVARRWAPNGYGGSAFAGKAWTAVLTLPPDDRQRWAGIAGQRAEVRITEGSNTGTYVSSAERTRVSTPAEYGSGTECGGSDWKRAPVRPPVLMTTGAWRHNPGPPMAYDAAREAEHARLAREAALAWQAEKRARRSLVGAL